MYLQAVYRDHITTMSSQFIHIPHRQRYWGTVLFSVDILQKSYIHIHVCVKTVIYD